MRVGLINFNRRGVLERDVPPVPPLGLEYLAEDLEAAAHEVSLLDLCFVGSADVDDALASFVVDKDAIGITFRNIGVDCYWLPDQQTFVPALCRIVAAIKRMTSAPVVLGGQGFSIYPKQILERTGADFGVFGPGERAFPKILASLDTTPKRSVVSEPANLSVVHKRRLIDYDRYIRNGGIPAISTKVGCPFRCAYCVEGGRPLQRRSLDACLEELRTLLSIAGNFVFVAEAEFNNHLRHATEFCDRIIDEGLEFRWSTYVYPKPLTEALVRKMKAAGCTNPCISFSAGDQGVLDALDNPFEVDRIREVASWFHAADLPFTVDLMFGTPRDTLASAARTIALMEEIRPALVGMNVGVRVYGGTPLGRSVMEGRLPVEHLYGHVESNSDLFEPIFYISDLRIFDYLEEVIESNGRYQLLGSQSFGGVNYKILENRAAEGAEAAVEPA